MDAAYFSYSTKILSFPEFSQKINFLNISQNVFTKIKCSDFGCPELNSPILASENQISWFFPAGKINWTFSLISVIRDPPAIYPSGKLA